MTVDIDKIDELARNATPGPWVLFGKVRVGATRRIQSLSTDDAALKLNVLCCYGDNSERLRDANSEYLAAVSPDVWLAVTAEVRELREYKAKKEALSD